MDQVRLKDCYCLPSETLTQSSSLNLSGSTRQQVKDIPTYILPAYCVIKPSIILNIISVSTAEEVPLGDMSCLYQKLKYYSRVWSTVILDTCIYYNVFVTHSHITECTCTGADMHVHVNPPLCRLEEI